MIVAALLLGQVPANSAEKRSCYVDKVQNGTTVREHIGYRACIDFTSPRRISGIWIQGFEASNFYEGLTHPDQLLGRKSTVWFATDRETVMPKGFKPTFRSNVYRVTFVGRTARDMNRKMFEGYGHFSMYPGLVIAPDIEVAGFRARPKRTRTLNDECPLRVESGHPATDRFGWKADISAGRWITSFGELRRVYSCRAVS